MLRAQRLLATLCGLLTPLTLAPVAAAEVDGTDLVVSGVVTGVRYGGTTALSGVEVTAYREHDGSFAPIATTQTEAASGRYELELPRGRYRLHFGSRRWFYDEWFSDAAVPEDAQTLELTDDLRGVDVDLVPQAELQGRLSGPGDTPVTGEVQAWRQTDAGWETRSDWRVQTAREQPTGQYGIRGLVEGQYRLRIAPDDAPARWWPDAPTRDEARSIIIGRSEVRTVDVVVDTSSGIRGRLTGPDDSPAEGVVRAVPLDVDDPAQQRSFEAATADDGTYVLDGLAPGRYLVQADAEAPLADRWWPVAVERDDATPVTLAGGEERSLDFTLGPGARITAQVPSGRPSYRLWRRAPSGWRVEGAPAGTRIAGRDLDLPGLTPGTYRLEFWERDSTSATTRWWWQRGLDLESATDVVLSPGETAELGTIEPPPTTSIAGRVTDEDGRPLSGVGVHVSQVRDEGRESVSHTATGADGTYRVDGLRSGIPHLVSFAGTGTFVGEWWSDGDDVDTARPIVLSGEPRTDIDAVLSRWGTIRGRVRDSAGLPVRAWIALYRARDGQQADEHQYIDTNPDGSYVVTGVRPGTWRVRAASQTLEPAFAPDSPDIAGGRDVVVTSGGETADVDVTLGVARTVVRGRVTVPWQHAEPYDYARARVTLVRRDAHGAGWEARTTSVEIERGGGYAFYGVEPGEYTAYFESWGHRSEYYGGRFLRRHAATFEVERGDDVAGIDAVLQPATGGLRGHISQATASPGLSSSEPQGWVRVWYDDGGDWSEVRTERVMTPGPWSAAGLPPGRYRVQFDSDLGDTEWWDNGESLEAARVVVVAPGQVVDHVDATLPGPAVLTGRVLRADGTPDAGAPVDATSIRDGAGGDRTTTDQDGRYRLVLPRTTRYAVTSGTATTLELDQVLAGPRSDAVVIDAETGTTAEPADLVTPPSNTIAGTLVQSGDREIRSVALMGPTGLEAFAPVADDGSFAFPGLADGTYRLTTGSSHWSIGQHYWPYGSVGASGGDIHVAGGTRRELVYEPGAPEVAVRSATRPRFLDSPEVGTPLVVDPGTWTVPDTTFEYRWSVGDRTLDGVAGPAYTPTVLDAGQQVRVSVVARRDGWAAGHSITAWSPPVEAEASPVVHAVEPPTVSGSPRVGHVLTAVPGRWIPSMVTFDYQWLRDGEPIDGAVADTYLVTATDRSHRVSVRVTGRRAGRADGVATAPLTARVLDPGTRALVSPSVPMDQQVGQPTEGDPGTFGPGDPDVSFQWYEFPVTADYLPEPIPGATSRQFTPTPEQALGRLALRVVVRDGSGEEIVTWSNQSGQVRRGDQEATLRPRIHGRPVVARVLRADAGRWRTTRHRATVQWFANGRPIRGATHWRFRARRADLGKRLSVRVDVVSAGYLDGRAGSLRTGRVTRPR